MSIVFTLPEVLQATLLAEWVALKDVGRLDSAVCNTQLRSTFLRLLQMKICVFRGRNCNVLNIEWIVQRNIKVQEVRLPQLDESLRKTFLQHVGPCIESMIVDSNTFPRRRNLVVSSINAHITTKLISTVELKLILDDLGELCSGMTRFEICFRRLHKVTFSEAIFDSICNLISQCSRLRCLTLTWIANFPVLFLEAIRSAHCLSSLQLDGCSLNNDARSLQTLSLYKNTTVCSYSCHSDTTDMAVMFPSLQTFSVQGLHLTSCLRPAFEHCPHVTSATLDFVNYDRADHLEAYLQGWPLLQSLCLMVQGRKISVPERSVLWLCSQTISRWS